MESRVVVRNALMLLLLIIYTRHMLQYMISRRIKFATNLFVSLRLIFIDHFPLPFCMLWIRRILQSTLAEIPHGRITEAEFRILEDAPGGYKTDDDVHSIRSHITASQPTAPDS